MAERSDLGSGLVYRLAAVKDVWLEAGDTNYDHLDFLIVGKHPEYPNKRSLIQFEKPTFAEEGRELKWAKMYLYYWYAHKASWHSVYQTKYISRYTR